MLLKASKENGYRPEENLNFETQARGQHVGVIGIVE